VQAAARWCAQSWHASDDSSIRQATSAPVGGQFQNSLGQLMITIQPPPQYLMGSPSTESDRATKQGAEQLHWRRIGRDFAIASTETTVALFKEFLADPRVKRAYDGQRFFYTDRYAPTPECPQISVRWYDAVRFCQWITEREQIPEAQWCYPDVLEKPTDQWQFPANLLERHGYRLPTEAEWEYACRGGSTAAYHFGGDRRLLPRYAWYIDTADERSHPVGSLMPNDFGLFDMHGNVSEWCHDAWHNYEVPVTGFRLLDKEADPAPSGTDPLRMLRGGAFEQTARQLRAADRTYYEPEKNHIHHGFRIARTVSQQPD
jgi:formylglycine-generating enzyme required for sulfatase activity